MLPNKKLNTFFVRCYSKVNRKEKRNSVYVQESLLHSVKLHRIRTPYSPDRDSVLPAVRIGRTRGPYSVEFHAVLVDILSKF